MLGLILMTMVVSTVSTIKCNNCYTLDTTNDELRNNMPSNSHSALTCLSSEEIPMCSSANISASECSSETEHCISLESVINKPDGVIYMGLYMCDVIVDGTSAFTCNMVEKALVDQGFHNCVERACNTTACNLPDVQFVRSDPGRSDGGRSAAASVTLSAFFITCALLYAFN